MQVRRVNAMSAKLSLKKLSLLIQTSPLLFYEREIKLKYICWQHEIKNTFVTFWNYPLLSRPNVLGSSIIWMCQISNICCFFRYVQLKISKKKNTFLKFDTYKSMRYQGHKGWVDLSYNSKVPVILLSLKLEKVTGTLYLVFKSTQYFGR